MTRHRSRLDEPPHGGAVAEQHAGGRSGAGVGVGIEVDECNSAVNLGDGASVGERDRVVAAEHDRNGAGPGHRRNGFGDAIEALLDVADGHHDVAGVDDVEGLQRIDAGRQVGPCAVEAEIAHLADRFGTEAGPRSMRGAPIERCAQNHHAGVAEVGDGPGRHTRERGTRGEGHRFGRDEGVGHGAHRSGADGIAARSPRLVIGFPSRTFV